MQRTPQDSRVPPLRLSLPSTALDAGGLTLADVQDDAPYNYGSGQGGAVNNYDKRYRGFTTLREGIIDSINVVAVKTLAQIGPSLGYDYIRNFGFTTVGIDESGNETLALGGLTNGVTNLELTAAYATIANSGTYIKPKFYTRILDHDGNVLLDNTAPESHTVLKETTGMASDRRHEGRHDTGNRYAGLLRKQYGAGRKIRYHHQEP